ncbi:hypothetical protein Ddc_21382 [Ditylenchus destructor]|nr:hypothetical protein Ddc_21382 [Ditylenchus destructor]
MSNGWHQKLAARAVVRKSPRFATYPKSVKYNTGAQGVGHYPGWQGHNSSTDSSSGLTSDDGQDQYGGIGNLGMQRPMNIRSRPPNIGKAVRFQEPLGPTKQDQLGQRPTVLAGRFRPRVIPQKKSVWPQNIQGYKGNGTPVSSWEQGREQTRLPDKSTRFVPKSAAVLRNNRRGPGNLQRMDISHANPLTEIDSFEDKPQQNATFAHNMQGYYGHGNNSPVSNWHNAQHKDDHRQRPPIIDKSTRFVPKSALQPSRQSPGVVRSNPLYSKVGPGMSPRPGTEQTGPMGSPLDASRNPLRPNGSNLDPNGNRPDPTGSNLDPNRSNLDPSINPLDPTNSQGTVPEQAVPENGNGPEAARSWMPSVGNLVGGLKSIVQTGGNAVSGLPDLSSLTSALNMVSMIPGINSIGALSVPLAAANNLLPALNQLGAQGESIKNALGVVNDVLPEENGKVKLDGVQVLKALAKAAPLLGTLAGPQYAAAATAISILTSAMQGNPNVMNPSGMAGAANP